MVKVKKDQLSLFGRPGRRIRPEPEVEPALPAEPGREAGPVGSPGVEPVVEPGGGAVAVLGGEAEIEAVAEAEVEIVAESEVEIVAEAEVEAVPEAEVEAVPEAEATDDGGDRPVGPRPGKAREQYLFPPEARRRLDLPFSRRMSDLVRRLQLLERDAKGHLDLTLPQSHAIHALMEAGSLRMQELAGTLGLAQSTVTRLVAPLKRMGLLDRRPDRNDGRATRAFLTPRGTALVDALERADRELYDQVLDRLPDTRRAEVVATIELLHEEVLDLLHERAQRQTLEQANS